MWLDHAPICFRSTTLINWYVEREGIHIWSVAVNRLGDWLFVYLTFLQGKHEFTFKDETPDNRMGRVTQQGASSVTSNAGAECSLVGSQSVFFFSFDT